MGINEITNKRISVIGAARSGVAAAQMLGSKGARVFVSDNGAAEKLTSQISTLKSIGVEFETGTHSERIYDADLIVISPGVPSSAPVVKDAALRRIKVVS